MAATKGAAAPDVSVRDAVPLQERVAPADAQLRRLRRRPDFIRPASQDLHAIPRERVIRGHRPGVDAVHSEPGVQHGETL